MRSSGPLFKKGFEDAFSKIPNLNASHMMDAANYMGMVETDDEEVNEKWSEKYKKSIDCKNPKGFSQKAHCQGKKKKEMGEEKLKGGIADKKTFEDLVNKNKKHGKSIGDIEKQLKNQLNKGIKVEMEHTEDKSKAKEIALDHLFEDPKYYDKLKKVENKEATSSGSSGQFSAPIAFADSAFVRRSNAENKTLKKTETKEATGSGSVGAYVTPAAWAKSTSKGDWRGKSKTQIPGGKFVSVKKKCKSFPYCNQGDIKALHIYENPNLKEAIQKVAEKTNLNEEYIKAIIQYELEKLK
jgi:hypothetical protein